ncbi:erythrocyte membrane protein 1, EMP1 [Plasmodium reichenowi]|uniref:Erythrocyte membrane protein 1, EMP1 n=1 Tax=Plasmodium reichenowi TaxID=5854 RepID=A0A060RM95_PLARE|nr:erythrocyte membrane protein 1, EMP1 [Plasmodium reichenowi]
MAPKPVSAPSTTTIDYSNIKNVKELLEEIGQKIQQQAHNDADQYREKLKGTLSKATFERNTSGKQTPSNPCELEYQYHTNVTVGQGREYPCRNEEEERFSEVRSGECDSKIKDNKGKEGACAPYRRLHLCDQNLENINRYDKINNDTLLTDVCLAAKYEGQSISLDHPRYKQTYGGSQLCTMLARSFADIGDIIRGKNLYIRNKKKDKLQQNLKEIFKKINENLIKDLKSDPDKTAEVEKRYQNDTGDFFKLREDWWNANRKDIWKAMTCQAHDSDKYFREKDTEGRECTVKKCKCIDGDPPTNLDYVPQYLRWFEEWAEDFCRKRKHKLENAKNKCRGENGEDKYCDLNGYDCKKTAIGNMILIEGDGCHKCSVACDHFVHWIDDKKQEFIKQKNKYDNEIKKNHDTPVRIGDTTINNLYVKDFYTELRRNYKTVEHFLEKLSEEKICKGHPEVGEGKKTSVDFKNHENPDIFSHTEYCQACPWCGIRKQNDGTWKRVESHAECKKEKKILFDVSNTTDIHLLSTDKRKSGILDKYRKFCKNNGKNGQNDAPATANDATGGDSQIKKWICHYEKKQNKDGNAAINNCIQGEWGNFTEKDKIMVYHPFFWLWVHDMVEDSIKWRKELGSCINNQSNKCVNKQCKDDCGCFEKWVAQKEKELKQIKQHFGKQGDMIDLGIPPGKILESVLDINDLFENIKDTYGEVKEADNIKEMLQKENNQGPQAVDGNGTEQNTTIDKLLKHEKGIATKCKNCQPKEVKNPCSGEKNDRKKYEAVAEKVAYHFQQQARTQLGESKSSLVGDITKAKIKGGSSVNTLNEEICSIQKNKHSNSANNDSKDPCNGKGQQRFNVGEEWTIVNGQKTSYGEVVLPQRRQHMCTSNLEKLNDTWVKNNGNGHVKDTFLVDLLLAAKSEAENIKNKLNENGIGSSICRTMKYSFADLGDIIRGRDMWDKDGGSNDIENKLKQIFPKIKDELKNKLGDKYNSDTEHKQLREDWWEANRDQVWKAMQCAIKNGNIQCGGTPYDDYIPQRLRWMVEWAEWFCKAQKKHYNDLETGCGGCMGKIKSRQGCTSDDCKNCTEACDKYRTEIKKWKPQWSKIRMKYEPPYSQAKMPSPGISLGGADNQQMFNFLTQLHTASVKSTKDGASSATKSPYESAAGYIHQELATYVGCEEQTQFCEKENGVTSRSSGAKPNEKYAFKTPPHGGACNCKNNEASSPEERGRAANPAEDVIRNKNEDESSSEHSDIGSEDEEDLGDGGDGAGDSTQDTVTEEPQKEKVDPNVCEIVGAALTNEKNLQDACRQKYAGNNPRLGWRCVTPSGSNDKASGGERGSKSDKNGAICIPPRRRKLYIGGLTKWARDETAKGPKSQDGDVAVDGKDQQAQSADNGQSTLTASASTSSPDATHLLRQAFIESAAVETFFLWDRYKKIKEKEREEKQEARGTVPGGALTDEDEDEANKNKDPQQSLQEKGKIPDEFKRQMFYTLGDYADILFGKNDILIQNTNNGVSAKDEMAEKEKQIKDGIEKFFEENGGRNEATSGKPQQTRDTASSPSRTPGQKTENPGQLRHTWWNKHAESIWNGMICALTYEDNKNGGKPEQITGANIILTKLKEDYKYENVKLDEEDSDGAKTAGEAPKLTEFVKRPFFFRWLEEWGDEFCRKQKHKLYIIEKDCRGKNGEKECSGDGFRCDDESTKKEDIFKPFNCPSCAISCRKYKKWIRKKKEEFTKQKNAYNEQKDPAKTNTDIYDKQFFEKLGKEYSSIELFMGKLKDGPCKNNSEEDQKVNGYIKFNEEETFQHTDYCKPCSKFKVECNGNGVCSDTKVTCTRGTISAGDIGKMGTPTHDVSMLVSDDSATGFEDELKDDCEKAGIFKGIRKDQWKCYNVCGVDICTLEKTSTIGAEGHKKPIIMKELVKRWLETFFEDYNEIRKKLKPCIENGNGEEQKCFRGCKKNCECVSKWIEKKRGEWNKINDTYLKEYKPVDDGSNNLKNFLETLIPQIDLTNDKRNFNELNDFLKAYTCKCFDTSQKSEEEKKKDIVECMLEDLGTKMTTCQTKHASIETKCEESAPLPDEEQNPEENTVGKHPIFCNIDAPKQETDVEEGGCNPVDPGLVSEDKKEDVGEKSKDRNSDSTAESTEPAVPGVEDQVPDNEDKGTKDKTFQTNTDEKPTKPTPPESPNQQQQPSPQTPKLDQPTNSISDILSSTIPFGIALALTSIAFLFLKKKTRRPVDMFSVLEIPQNDYGMPTKLSSNRYIPYKSAQYRGKRYIYIEGDTDEEKYMFMSDTTDITSSESEYEEFDINDIYPYQSPKYKTLIEVVLEPSGNTIPDSGKNTPTSDTPTNKFTEEEWNELKHNFISNMLQNTQNTEPNILHDNVDNNTHPIPSRHNVDQKPFIMSIHDRNLFSGEEYNYDMINNIGNNDLYGDIYTRSGDNVSYSGTKSPISDNHDSHSDIDPTSDNRDSLSGTKNPISGTKNPYSSIDLINDSLSGNQHIDIYDEILKRKENELFGTNHVKHTSTHSVAKHTNSDPIMNQLDLFHTWLDRHRDMCEKWDTNNKVDILNQLKEKWDNETPTSGNIHPSDSNKTLNTDVSIQINMNDPKPINEFTNMDTNPDDFIKDTILNDLEKHREPYFYDIYDDDITYFDIDDEKKSMGHIYVDNNKADVPNEVHIEMNIANNKKEIFEEEYPISDIWNI